MLELAHTPRVVEALIVAGADPASARTAAGPDCVNLIASEGWGADEASGRLWERTGLASSSMRCTRHSVCQKCTGAWVCGCVKEREKDWEMICFEA